MLPLRDLALRERVPTKAIRPRFPGLRAHVGEPKIDSQTMKITEKEKGR